MNSTHETHLIRYRRACIWMLYALCFMAPLGALSRFWSTSESDVSRGLTLIPGPTTVIIVLLVSYGICCRSIPRLILRQNIWMLIVAFVAVTVVAAFFQFDARNGCIRSVMFTVYFFLMLFVINLQLSEKQMTNLLLSAAAGMSVMLFLSLIDYYKIVNVPLVNLRSYSLSIEGDRAGISMRGLSGPFRSRSELSAFLSVLIPPFFGCVIYRDVNWWRRIVFLAAVGIGSFAVLISSSRAMYLSLAVSFAYILFCFLRSGHTGRVIVFFMLGIVSLTAVLLLNQDYYFMLIGRLSQFSVEHISYSEGDMMRVYALQETFKEMLTKPWGMGFTNVIYYGRLWDVHSIFTEFIRAAGVIGLGLMLAFGIQVYRFSRIAAKSDYRAIFFSGFIGFLVYNIAHTYWQVSVLWVLMGCYFTVLFRGRAMAYYGRRID